MFGKHFGCVSLSFKTKNSVCLSVCVCVCERERERENVSISLSASHWYNKQRHIKNCRLIIFIDNLSTPRTKHSMPSTQPHKEPCTLCRFPKHLYSFNQTADLTGASNHPHRTSATIHAGRLTSPSCLTL